MGALRIEQGFSLFSVPNAGFNRWGHSARFNDKEQSWHFGAATPISFGQQKIDNRGLIKVGKIGYMDK